jgi:hypothetical protein
VEIGGDNRGEGIGHVEHVRQRDPSLTQ